MNNHTPNLPKPLQVLAGAFVVAHMPFTCGVCQAQAPQDPAIATQQVGASFSLDENTIQGEAGLQVPVTFEAKRQKLPDVLSALQAQSGVTLTLALGSTMASKLLTARAESMPLAQVMVSISHLYGGAWIRKGAAFEMKSNEHSDIENAAWKLPSTSANASKAARTDPIDWNQEVAQLGAARLRQKGGVALDELPDDIVQKLRARSEERDVTQLGVELSGLRPQNLVGATMKASDDSIPEVGKSQIRIRLFLPDEELVSEYTIDVVPDAK